jgi:H+-transporting ATPase
MGSAPQHLARTLFRCDVLIISTLATFGIAVAPLPIAIIAAEFGAAVIFGAILDIVKVPVFARLRVS